MIDAFLNGGPFMMLLLILLGIIIFISVKNINKPYNTNSIVLLGIFSALVGISPTYIGINSAFSSVSDISKISPQDFNKWFKDIINYINNRWNYYCFSTGLWYFFIRRYNLLEV